MVSITPRQLYPRLSLNMGLCGPQNRLNIWEMKQTCCLWLAATGTALSVLCIPAGSSKDTEHVCPGVSMRRGEPKLYR